MIPASNIVSDKYLLTVIAPIERHSWLERHEAHFRHTMVVFGQFSSKITVFFGQKIDKNDHCEQPKNLKNQ